MKNYYVIDELICCLGKFELWESEIYGEDAIAIVTLNGVKVGATFDSLSLFVRENYDL